jgi:ribonuclease HI
MTDIYTDGSCLKNPGKGGWAFVIVKDNKIKFIGSGADKNTTNNRMELFAIIKALEYNQKANINIYSDSKWAINCATKLWKRKANLDLWLKYDSVSSRNKINYIWVKAHNGNTYNELVDKLAYKEASKI